MVHTVKKDLSYKSNPLATRMSDWKWLQYKIVYSCFSCVKGNHHIPASSRPFPPASTCPTLLWLSLLFPVVTLVPLLCSQHFQFHIFFIPCASFTSLIPLPPLSHSTSFHPSAYSSLFPCTPLSTSLPPALLFSTFEASLVSASSFKLYIWQDVVKVSSSVCTLLASCMASTWTWTSPSSEWGFNAHCCSYFLMPAGSYGSIFMYMCVCDFVCVRGDE